MNDLTSLEYKLVLYLNYEAILSYEGYKERNIFDTDFSRYDIRTARTAVCHYFARTGAGIIQ